jgi:hypothetical protein
MTGNREWLAAKLSHQYPQGHFRVLRADLFGIRRYNRSEFRMYGPAAHCHGRNSRRGTGTGTVQRHNY